MLDFGRLSPSPQPAARLALAFLFLTAISLRAQPAPSSDEAALQDIRAAVNSELHFSETDKSTWTYRDHDSVPGKDATYTAIETEQGDLRRMILLDGHPLSAEASQTDLDRLQRFVTDPDAQARKRRAAAHDGAQAAAFLRMLPNAFLWTITSQNAESVTLDFHPNPSFDPPDMQARVMSVMAGQVVIHRDGNRIQTIRGRLTHEVPIGWGLLGHINAGGTFDVERREVGGGHWQITESHVHIGGHALIFKTIGEQEDEEKTDWRPSPAHNLQQALQILSK